MSSGAIVLAGELYGNVLRLGSNLIMTRLLYPEAFGLMLIVNLLMGALIMLSDVGLRASLISKEGDPNPTYVNTAWTIMIVRGGILAVICLALAYPIASFYDDNALIGLILVTSLAPLIRGFTSPFPILEEKKVKLARVVGWRVFGQTAATIVTICWLLIHPSVWALAAHGVTLALVTTITSFTFFPAPPVRLEWDKTVAAEFYNFGRWIMIGTAFTFLGRQGDSLVVSKFLSMEALGLFSIAVALSKLVEMIAEKLSWNLLFPVYSELKTESAAKLKGQTRRIRMSVYSLCFPVVAAFSVLGGELIDLMYDPRYSGAGWMLEVMSFGGAFYVLGSTVNSVPLAHGDSQRHMVLQVMRVISLSLCMTLGGVFYGVVGLIFGIALAQIMNYVLIQFTIWRYGVSDLPVDLAFVAVLTLATCAGWSILGWPQPFS